MTAFLGCWLKSPAARLALRRSMPRRGPGPRLRVCRSPRALVDLFQGAVVDAAVIDARHAPPDLWQLPRRYESVPILGLASFRSDDGHLLTECRDAGLAGVLVEGLDDLVLWPLLAVRTASACRKRLLAAAPRHLRLTEPIQRRVWDEVLTRATGPISTRDLAVALGVTREHLSREVGAGGAPNLKRVIDLARAICAADLLRCQAYTVKTVADLLGYASPGHLSGAAERVTGLRAPALRTLGIRGVLQRFMAGRTRSRL